MKKIQGSVGTALAYCVARRFLDARLEMRQVWGWFAIAFSVLLAATIIIERFKTGKAGK